jgi:CheY-like chemotaxis protein
MATKTIMITVPGIPVWPKLGYLEDSGSNGERATTEKRPIVSSVRKNSISRRIAIVDDEKDLTLVFSMIIRSLGHRTEFVAHDGNEIIQAIMEGKAHPDTILMDYRMGSMNGIQTAQKIRQMHPEIEIIIATADDRVKEETDAAGLFFIQKPFSIAELDGVIDEASSDDNSSATDAGGR